MYVIINSQNKAIREQSNSLIAHFYLLFERFKNFLRRPFCHSMAQDIWPERLDFQNSDIPD